MPRILSGVQPSGCLTLGNYLGAIKNWVGFQNTHDCLFCIVDLHAITVPQDPQKLKKQTREVAATYIASGIDPKKSTIFVQSQISQHAELAWILNCITPLGWLNRMTQFKDKAGKNKDKAFLGLYSYPVLMAADILLYKATHVPVGQDQKQHLELARDIAGAFNCKFNKEFFPIPEPEILGQATRIMSLRDGTSKMSKSDPSDFSRITFDDDNDSIISKIKKAKTDPIPISKNSDDLENRPEVKNLINIYSSLSNMDPKSVCKQYDCSTFAPFKKDLADLIIEKIGPIRDEKNRLLNDTDHLDKILKEGSEKARLIAKETFDEVRNITGLLTF